MKDEEHTTCIFLRLQSEQLGTIVFFTVHNVTKKKIKYQHGEGKMHNGYCATFSFVFYIFKYFVSSKPSKWSLIL